MWIKSQDCKKLVNCNDIYIEEGVFNADHSESHICCEYGKLGTYRSKEQAEKVLENIQNSIMGYFSMYYDDPYDCTIAGTEYHGIFTMPSIDECNGDDND